MRFWNLSLGLESSAMVWICRDEIKESHGTVVFADTGKQFPEAYASLYQIERLTNLHINIVKQDYSFNQFLLERGGMLKQGFTDCSRRMKRSVLRRFHSEWPYPWEINLGYNADEQDRADAFSERNNTSKQTWRYPLIERGIRRSDTVRICEEAGFTVVLEMYRKMGRMDCYFCPNQKIAQAQKVMKHYPDLWAEWKLLEEQKGYAFLKVSAKAIEEMPEQQEFFERLDKVKAECGCFGGEEFEAKE